MSTLQKIRHRNPFKRYDFRRLIDTRYLFPDNQATEHIICDIDKTYLETNTEGAIQMLKIAFEDAKDKITVPGASPFLIAARWSNPYRICQKPESFIPRSLHFVSASPPQLRRILEEKLIHDGLDWNSDSFKNQAYNIRKGRLDLLRHHVAYKTATALKIMKNVGDGSSFYLVGDNAEFDAFIYLGLAYFFHGKLSIDAYERYLQAGGVEREVASDLRSLMANQPRVSIAGILIRKAPGFTFVGHPPLTDPLIIFRNYYEAALTLIRMDLIEPEALWPLTCEFHNQHHFSREQLASALQTAMTQDFSKDSKAQPYLQECMHLLNQSGPLNQLIPSPSIIPTASITEIHLNQEEIVKEAKAWTEKLAANTTTLSSR